jgi:hypothetical protein
MLSLEDPLRPESLGCFSDLGRGNGARDAQCVVYRGPDADYRGREICFVASEEFVTIADVEDKSAPRLIARTSFRDAVSVNHGGLTADHRYYLQGDTGDELAFGHNTRTYVWDMADLDHPVLAGYQDGDTRAMDYHMAVRGNELHRSITRGGYQMLSLSSVGRAQLDELAYLRLPSDSPLSLYVTASYPHHASGLVTVSDGASGLLVLRPTGCRTPATPRPELPPDGAVELPLEPSLDWSDVGSAASYDVEVATDARFENVVRSASGPLGSWTVAPALERGTTYHWRARAATGCSAGAWSFGSSITTLANRPPVLDPILDKAVSEGAPLVFTVNASDADGDPLVYGATGLPAGATFDAATRSFAWTPGFDQAGSYSGVSFSVDDQHGGTDAEAITITVLNTNRPPVANAGPDQTVQLGTEAILDGTGSSDPDGDLLLYSWRQLSGIPVAIGDPGTARASVTLRRPGSYVFELSVSDDGWRTRVSDSVTITAKGALAAYDPVLRAPRCDAVADSCDSGDLVAGRDGVQGEDRAGGEPHQPNTIFGSCADGTRGTLRVDESVDRVKVTALDGGILARGAWVRVEATVWAWAGNPDADKLDLYYAADATKPLWKPIASLTPGAGGAQTLAANYRLPAGAVQAVRARFRYLGSKAPCGSGAYDDHDDLVFRVQPASPVEP